MTTRYRLRSLAQDDLESIWLHTRKQWGVIQADTYIEALIKRFEWLAENAKVGKPRNDVKKGYYCFPEGMHLIFYILKDNQVEIIGIPHQRMDIVDYLA
ncbi:MAG: type II toxin-antitoxin system RelE/ParE family toxin [Cycloclasticus sp.]|nr:type II toxin-antitoxin system RelE/ParE family toxin [Cycloclasticus sp.]